jgi:hypothetical protein
LYSSTPVGSPPDFSKLQEVSAESAMACCLCMSLRLITAVLVRLNWLYFVVSQSANKFPFLYRHVGFDLYGADLFARFYFTKRSKFRHYKPYSA